MATVIDHFLLFSFNIRSSCASHQSLGNKLLNRPIVKYIDVLHLHKTVLQAAWLYNFISA